MNAFVRKLKYTNQLWSRYPQYSTLPTADVGYLLLSGVKTQLNHFYQHLLCYTQNVDLGNFLNKKSLIKLYFSNRNFTIKIPIYLIISILKNLYINTNT
jgi:hypothetical protein